MSQAQQVAIGRKNRYQKARKMDIAYISSIASKKRIILFNELIVLYNRARGYRRSTAQISSYRAYRYIFSRASLAALPLPAARIETKGALLARAKRQVGRGKFTREFSFVRVCSPQSKTRRRRWRRRRQQYTWVRSPLKILSLHRGLDRTRSSLLEEGGGLH